MYVYVCIYINVYIFVRQGCLEFRPNHEVSGALGRRLPALGRTDAGTDGMVGALGMEPHTVGREALKATAGDTVLHSDCSAIAGGGRGRPGV